MGVIAFYVMLLAGIVTIIAVWRHKTMKQRQAAHSPSPDVWDTFWTGLPLYLGVLGWFVLLTMALMV